MSGRVVKLLTILLVLAGGALALLSWSAPWVTLTLVEDAGSATIEVPGSVASPALAALGLAALALAAALAIAGPVIRVVLCLLSIVLAGCIGLAVGVSLADPLRASSAAISDRTGIAGAESVSGLVGSFVVSGWPVAAIVSAALLLAAGVGAIAFGRRWPVSGRKYRTGAVGWARRPEDRPADRAVDEWDELSRGADPTEPPRAT